MLKRKKRLTPTQSVMSWFLICFLCFSLIMMIFCIPLISYCETVFTELEVSKSTQIMDFGVSQLENTIINVVSASQSLYNDIRFLPFLYLEPDYSEISVSVRNQLSDYLDSLLLPLDLISDSALQFSENIVITPERTIFNEPPGYYPYFFCVDGMNYDEWEMLLSENRSRFLPIQRVVTRSKSYDALIYAMPWTETSYFYVCMNISAIKQALIDKNDLSNYCLTIDDADGNCLYSDVLEESMSYYSVTKKTSYGGLIITVHIPISALTERMEPLYRFLGMYLLLCVIVIIIATIIGSRISSKPLLKIINMLETQEQTSGNHAIGEDNCAESDNPRVSPLHTGFHYIHEQMRAYEIDLSNYRSIIDSQVKILQARFLEKALQGSLVGEQNIELFYSYFPEFPDRYCLVQLGVIEQENCNGNVYHDPLALIQVYLQANIPNTYTQQLTYSELLMIIDESDFAEATTIINYLIDNVNREEPSYHIWCIASKFFDNAENLPTAYQQLQNYYSRVSVDTLKSLHIISTTGTLDQPIFQISDTTSFYTAITYGNEELALLKLDSYSECLRMRNYTVFEMIRSVLLCIKQEYPDTLSDLHVPTHYPQVDMYNTLKIVISDFCQAFNKTHQSENAPFAQKVKLYIDNHYNDIDLCYSTIADHFQCSASKIRSAFSQVSNISVSSYIENKRMIYANELLLQGNYTVSEVAQMCGYANSSTFYKAYRRKFGQAPSSMKQD